jgi:DNA-binding transcriptional LysR family regulator
MAFDGRLLGGISVLAAVVETGNFVRAAEALGLTQSGISRAVARLEARVGVRLLDRTPRAVSLTDEGRRFHTQVAPLLAGLEEAASEATEASHAVRGRLKINVDPWFARLVLAPRLSGLLAAHPQLSIELVVRDTLGDLVSEGFDVAVRFGEPEPSGLDRAQASGHAYPHLCCAGLSCAVWPATAPARPGAARMPSLS